MLLHIVKKYKLTHSGVGCMWLWWVMPNQMQHGVTKWNEVEETRVSMDRLQVANNIPISVRYIMKNKIFWVSKRSI